MADPEIGWVLSIVAAFGVGAFYATAFEWAKRVNAFLIRVACRVAWWGGYAQHAIDQARRRKRGGFFVEEIPVEEVDLPAPVDITLVRRAPE